MNVKTGDHIIGVDVGTSSLKAALFDETLKQVSFHQVEYPLIYKENGHIEQDSALWYTALCESIKKVVGGIDAGRVAALALSTQGGTLVCLDAQHNARTNAVSWMDNRHVERDGLLPAGMSVEDVRVTTGWDLNNNSIYSKLCWYTKQEPKGLGAASYVADCGSLLHFRLCGNLSIDHTNAAISQLFDIDKRTWSMPFLSRAEIRNEQLPVLVPPGMTIGRLTPGAGADLGLSVSTEVISGGHDQYCAALGAGVTQSGDCLLSGGTAWVILAVLERPEREMRESGGFACGLHVVDGMYGVLSSIPRAGAAMAWFHETFAASCGGDRGVAGADGLEFSFDSAGRMSFQNIDFHHKPAHFQQAIMEGIAVHLNEYVSAWESCGVAVEKFIMTGGAARSPVWPQIVADVTNRVVRLPSYSEFACRGAAILAGMGCGLFKGKPVSDTVALNYPDCLDIKPGPGDG